jgi:hypothetical protein
MEGNGFSMVGSCANFVEPFARDTLKRYNYEHCETMDIPFPAKAYVPLYREMCRGKVRQGGEQIFQVNFK